MTRSTSPAANRLAVSDRLPMTRSGSPPSALSRGTSVSTGSDTNVVFAHDGSPDRVLEKTSLGSSVIRVNDGSSPSST